MIPYGRQSITQADIESVVEVLKSDFLTQGPMVPAFEESLKQKFGCEFAIASSNATSALHLSCLALGLGVGDLLWTTPITFVASANCGLYCGARVDFVDIDPVTWNLCPQALEEKLIEAQLRGDLPKVLVVVHFTGEPCDMLRVNALSKKYGFSVIEDASHAIGAKYRGEYVGNCRYSDITVFSFHPVKIITSAEGGAALTNNPRLADSVRLCRSHGITRDENLMKKKSDGPWFYQQIALGFNFRMTDIQAALGISQLKSLDENICKRRKLVQRYLDSLTELPLTLPNFDGENSSAHHLFVVRVQHEKVGVTRRQVFDFLRENGIGVNVHYIPVHTQPVYQSMGFLDSDFPESMKFYREALTLPMFPDLSLPEQEHVISNLQQILRGNR